MPLTNAGCVFQTETFFSEGVEPAPALHSAFALSEMLSLVLLIWGGVGKVEPPITQTVEHVLPEDGKVIFTLTVPVHSESVFVWHPPSAGVMQSASLELGLVGTISGPLPQPVSCDGGGLKCVPSQKQSPALVLLLESWAAGGTDAE